MRALPLRAIAVAAATTLALGVGVSQAQAVTWTKTANTTQKAYATAGYKAKVGASSAPAVSGYTRYSTTVSIKNSAGTYVAKNVSSKWLSKGTYKVYSTFKYRKKVAHTTTVTKTGTVNVSELESGHCDVMEATYNEGSPDLDGPFWTGIVNCYGTYQGHPAKGNGLSLGTVPLSDVPELGVGDEFEYGSRLWELFVTQGAGTGPDVSYSYTVKSTTYTWSYTNRYRYRYATVAKVTAPRSWWTNCTTVNSHFPHGVGKSGARDHTSGTRVTTFLVSSTVYAEADRANGGLDRDNDGIACEKR